MNKPIRVVIVDDEPDAVTSIELIIKEFNPDLQVVGTSNIIDNAWEVIKETEPELVFLDIDMPRGSGFDLLERFPIRKFEVIFITAYAKYMEKAKNYHSFDYLLKPIDIDIFNQTIARFKAHIEKEGIIVFKMI